MAKKRGVNLWTVLSLAGNGYQFVANAAKAKTITELQALVGNLKAKLIGAHEESSRLLAVNMSLEEDKRNIASERDALRLERDNLRRENQRLAQRVRELENQAAPPPAN